ncbi:MAG TPA: FecR family protein, partial [Chitinophagaceae bacterium]
ALFIFISLGAILWIRDSKKEETDLKVAILPQYDALPASNRAILKLADNSEIILDSAGKGLLAKQGNAKILKTSDGQLAYDFSQNSSTEILYNTLSTPRGGQYQVILSDGTKVWLNAATSIRFPTAFAGNERVVELTGEAYFEVEKNEAMPFIVKTNKASVQVLGTHFNVMAYPDEEDIKTTLLEGKVKVSGLGKTALLAPGQQAVLDHDNSLQLIKNVDTEEVISWKNGYFRFPKIDKRALRQVSRWYDVDVIYEAPIKEREYSGTLDRNVKLSNIVEALKVIGINARLEKNSLVIMQ